MIRCDGWRRAAALMHAPASIPKKSPSRTGADWPEIVRFLSRRAALGERANRIEVLETHMSWVVLAPDRVFKLKKPMRTTFLDFSTCAARERFCKEEVRLNRRLAPHVYLAAVPVSRAQDGELCLGGKGEAVDWLVEMRRLPKERTLNCALASGTASRQDIERVLTYLYSFLASAPAIQMEESHYLDCLESQQAENRRVLAGMAHALPREKVRNVLEILRQTIDLRPDWLFEPLEKRRIIEGHGDLRPEHIYLTDPPAIIDCLEFNRDLRLLDPFDDLSYLALECTRLGAESLAAEVVDAYARRVGIRPPPPLLDFYRGYRATIRARLAIAHLFDWPRRDAGRWTAQARAYLEIAHAACLTLARQEVR